MITKFHISSLKPYRGCTAGLSDKTALVSLRWEGDLGDWSSAEARLREHVLAFRTHEPLTGRSASDWPQAFLRNELQSPYLGDWVVALCIALQRWARDPAWQGEVLNQGEHQMTLALPYAREGVLRQGLQFALRLILLWLNPQISATSVTKLYAELDAWFEKCHSGGLAPNTLRFALAARARQIPIEVQGGVIQLGWGRHARKLHSSFSDATSTIATSLARNKIQTSRLLAENAVPVPPTSQVADWSNALKIAQKFGWPVVVKPSNQDQGLGVVPGIRDETTLQQAFEAAAKLSPGAVIVEKHIDGEDHRMLVVGGKLLMATRRIPAGVVGDGHLAVRELVQAVNQDPRRGTSKRSLLIKLELDEEASQCLVEQMLTAESVPAVGKFVRLRRTANISTGGTPEDVTNRVHPDNRIVCERAARLLGLDIAGVDFLCPDISRSWREVGGAICEVNAQPGFRPHWLGDPSRDINGEIVDWMFHDKPARIPTAAITGTNGKSTVARMLHHIWMTAGKVAGVCTTNGVWVGHDLISTDNLSGQPGGRLLLNDPLVDVAVIEMPRKGLIHYGHPCDRYDVAALLNVQDDHIGVDGIDSLDAMANLKAEVLARSHQAVVVNAEDPRCMAALELAGCARHILVAMHPDAVALRQHLAKGGDAVFAAPHRGERWAVVAEGAQQTPLMPLREIPATMAGLLRFNESNALFAIALALAQGVKLDSIRQAMASFANTPAQNPGRYNVIEGFPFKVLLDYGHNPDGVKALCEVVSAMDVHGQRRLLNLKIGNRHRAHLNEVAPALAKTFNRFVLGCDEAYVRKSADYVGDDPPAAMLAASQAALANVGVAPEAMTTERGYRDAIRLALNSAKPGDLLVLLAEPWDALAVIDGIRGEKP